MSMTDLKALAESWLIWEGEHAGREGESSFRTYGSKKVACSASAGQVELWNGARRWVSCSHQDVNATELSNTSLNSLGQTLHAPDIHGTNTNDLGSWPGRTEVLGHTFGLLDIAADDARVGSEMHKSPDLSTADRPSTTGTEDNTIYCSCQSMFEENTRP